MTNAWWDRGERATTRRQIAMRFAAAFGAVALTLSIWWPAGIVVALLVCGVATVLANRMIEAAEEAAADRRVDLAALLGTGADGEPA